MKNKLNRFWEWIFDRHESDSEHSYSHQESTRVKVMILVVIGFVLITAIVMLAVWIDNYVKYHF